MAKILLIETATDVCSTAIAADGQVLALRETPNASSHSALLTLQIEACVAESGIALAALDAIAVSGGPGAYTSLRVGVATAKGLCFALDKPLIAVDTLLALAAASLAADHSEKNTSPTTLLLPMIDARRQEVWTAVYDPGLSCLVPAQPLIMQDNLFYDFLAAVPNFTKSHRVILSGSGGKKLENVPFCEQAVVSPVVACSARYLTDFATSSFKKGEFQDIAYYEPRYMKPPNITTPGKNLF